MRDARYEPEAAEELAAAIAWYEGERVGLGAALLDEVEAVIALLRSGGAVASPVPGVVDPAVRRILLARYPYAVVFVEHGDLIHIVAVAHTKRAPGYWARRIP